MTKSGSEYLILAHLAEIDQKTARCERLMQEVNERTKETAAKLAEMVTCSTCHHLFENNTRLQLHSCPAPAGG